MSRTKNAGVQKAKCMVKEMSLTETMREAVEYYRKKKMDRKSEDAYVYGNANIDPRYYIYNTKQND